MFGLKFRSWMESHIVRPRKKQQQQQQLQQQHQQPPTSRAKGKGVPDRALDSAGNSPTSPKSNGSRPHHASASAAAAAGVATAPGSCGISLLAHAQQRPTAHSLSSPESAYSTGYSTDGTSPGASFPPEYYINLRTGTHYFHNQQAQAQVTEPSHRRTESCDVGAEVTHLEEAVPSPRQRNRIRTNPWLAGSSLSSSGSSSRHQPQQQVHRPSSSGSDITLPRRPDVVSPISNTCVHPTPPAVSPRVLSPRRSSLCSSASSSTSSSQSTAASSSMHTPNNLSAEEDDVTLNEMLGKYDESYVYEKETDILSDSDPTDCEEDTDFDTGQDGGDENDDDDELDFIDDGSCLDLDPLEAEERCGGRNINKGHCTYHIPVAGHPDLPAARKPPLRFRESFMRRSSNRRHQQPGKDDGTSVTNSPGASSRHSSLRKLPEEGFLHQNRRSSNRHRRHDTSHVATNVNITSTRNPSEKKRVRCSVRRNVNLKENASTVVANENSLLNSIQSGQAVNRENIIESGGVLNLNRVLMQKMLERSNMTGTRSAGNTPVSLRRRILNGDVPDVARKNFSPSKIISQEVNKNQLAHDNGNNTCSLDIPTSPKTANNSPKQRSNSVSYTTGISESHKAMPSSNYLATFASEMALIEADKEADRKYKELILEAEHILVSMKGNIPEKCINFMVPKPKPFFLKSNYIIDGFPKPKPFNPIPNKVGDQNDRILNDNDITVHGEMVRSKLNSPKRIIDGLSAQKHSQDSQNGNLSSALDNERNRQGNREVRKVLLSPRRRQNKTTRNVPICGSSSSESDGSTTPQQEEKPFTPKIPVSCSTNNFQKPSLVTFRSIDLGNAIESSRYCPQSEPVKRKVYSCSATFDRLQKTLEKSQHASLRYKAELTQHGENGVEKSGRESLKEKLKQLRKERLEVEAKVREAQEDERRRRDDKSQCQRQLSLFRRQMLVHTIEGLKRSLEDQSAKLQETYQSTENSPLISRRHSSSSVNRQIEQEVHEEEQ